MSIATERDMRSIPERLTTVLAALAMVVTVVIAVWMAQPWSGEPPYDSPVGYLMMLALLAWACGPYLFIVLQSRRAAARPLPALRLALALIVCIGGCAALFDAAFIHIDAQSALVLLFLAPWQWLLIGLVEAAGRWFARRRQPY